MRTDNDSSVSVFNIVLMNGVELHTDVSDLLITNLILIITINN